MNRKTVDRQGMVTLLQEAESLLLLIHIRPDGDSIGSSIALGRALSLLGKHVELVRVDELPKNLNFLPDADRFRFWEEIEGEFDAAVFLDCGDLERIGAAQALLGRCKRLLNVDHHLSNAMFGDFNLIEPEAAAVGEIVFSLIDLLGVELDETMAAGIYTAIVTDTGSFMYESTSPQTHRIAAKLLQCGVQPQIMGKHLWEEKSLSSLKLTQVALARLQQEGELAYTSLRVEDFHSTGAGLNDTEGLVAYPRILRGVEVALLFVERTAETQVSLRSAARVDVSRVARRLGGGGHARAAGCTLKVPLSEAMDIVLAEVRQELGRGAADDQGAED